MQSECREKRLFNLVHQIGEYQSGDYSIDQIDEDDGIRYRCNYGAKGIFEIARIKFSNEYMEFDSGWTREGDYIYYFSGKQLNGKKEMIVLDALELISKYSSRL